MPRSLMLMPLVGAVLSAHEPVRARHGMVVIDRDHRGKEQVLLQLAFVHGFGGKMMVLQRRLAPMRIPAEAAGPEGKRFLLRRAWFHFVTFFKFLRLAVGQWL